MKKQDKLKLDVISGMDEKIIDEATDRRIALSKRAAIVAAKMRRRWMAIGGMAAAFVLLLSLFLTVFLPLIGSAVPVYQGMTIRKESAHSMQTEPDGAVDIQAAFLSANSGKSGISKDPHHGHEERLEQEIRDLVTIDVVTDDVIRYYVQPGETFIIEVHIDNPDDFEIQSFTLNGRKYANYMFKDGSTMELLLLEVTAPTEPGYTKYTIDAIKYIDGTEIKDVDMSGGDQSIKAGIAYPTAPSAVITSQSILPTSIDLQVMISDPHSLIGDRELFICLSDGEKVVATQPLQVGENQVTFDHLIMSRTYEYGIVTSFDLVDGRDLHQEWLLTQSVTTAGAFGISNATPTKDSVSFAVTKTGDTGTVTSISLYDAVTNELVAMGGPDTTEFGGLLSDHAYNLYVDFTYTVDGKEMTDWTAVKGIVTAAKTAPRLTIGAVSESETALSGSYSVQDDDGICKIASVELYREGTLVQANAHREVRFTGLDAYTAYQIVITYTYDLNDGSGVQTATAALDCKTAPHLSFNSCTVANTSAVSEGDTIFLQINIQNPNRVEFHTIVVNGKEYAVVKNSSTDTMLYCEIVNSGQFEGGNTPLTVEKIVAKADGKTYAIEPSANNVASVFINGKLEVLGCDNVILKDGKCQRRDYFFPGEEVYLRIKLHNPTGYTVDTILLKGVEHTDFIQLNSEECLLPMSSHGSEEVNGLRYSIGGTGKTVTFRHYIQYHQLDSDRVYYISTPADLMNMNDGMKYYELTCDIDLAGMEWRGNDFFGVLNGNGHTIRNMSFVGSITNQSAVMGLFATGSGVIKDLHLEGVRFVIKQNINDGGSYSAVCGGMIGDAYNLTLENCTVDKTSVINTNTGSVGGLVGNGTDVCFINCENHASVSGRDGVGGLAGGVAGELVEFINCTNTGTVTSQGNAGGFVASATGKFQNCTNSGAVSGDRCVGGLIGWGTGSFTACTNSGTVNGRSYVGGIAGDGHYRFTDCMNAGSVNGIGRVGGIIGECDEVVTIVNCANFGTVYGKNSVAGIACGGKCTATGCINYGELSCGENVSAYPIASSGTFQNCYAPGKDLTVEQLNTKSFYTGTLGWDASVWNLDGLDVENGKYPTLK